MKTSIDPRKIFPRRFVPDSVDLGDWKLVESLAEVLLTRQPHSPGELERWLEDGSELFAALLEERSRRSISMAGRIDDPSRERAYLAFVRKIDPRMEILNDRLDSVYLQNRYRRMLPKRYRLLDRRIENRHLFFREENMPLEVREDELRVQYQKLASAMTVAHRGEERTLQQMSIYMESPDRSTRQEAWELASRCRLEKAARCDRIFDRLLRVRVQMAGNAGFQSYSDYVFRRYERFDYTPANCFLLHDVVQAHFVPLIERLARERASMLGVNHLRPWDLEVDPLGRPPLRPFEGFEQFLDRAEFVFCRVDAEFGAYFRFMREEGLLDLESRKGKAAGNYLAELTERRWPFIFMNAVGLDRDVWNLLHEGGHAFHLIAAREEPLVEYRDLPLEFAEAAALGMELLSVAHLGVFYPKRGDLYRAYRSRLESIIHSFARVATVDAFQHWLYAHPIHTPHQRRETWLQIYTRFHGRGVDWSGYEEDLAYMWHQTPLIFLHPFYFIEYGIGLLGALQIWLHSRRDYRDAVARYRSALRLGAAYSLPELFEAAGARFAFDGATVAPLAMELTRELENIPYA